MCKLSVAASQEFGKTWGALARESQFDGDDDDEGALNGFNLRCAVGVPSGDEDEESESSGGAEREGEWEEWRGDPARVTCLFCEASYGGMEDLLMHMTAVHDFDFRHVRNALRLDFYGQVKMVNYVRRKVHLGECMHCQDRFDSRDEMLEHMAEEEHFRPPDDAFEWNRPGRKGENKLLFNREIFSKIHPFCRLPLPYLRERHLPVPPRRRHLRCQGRAVPHWPLKERPSLALSRRRRSSGGGRGDRRGGGATQELHPERRRLQEVHHLRPLDKERFPP